MNNLPAFGSIRYDITTFLQRNRELLKPTVLQVGSKRLFREAWWANQRGLLGYDRDKWVGVDIVPGPGVDMIHDFNHDLPDEMEAKFGSVVATEVLEHIEHPLSALENMYYALEPGGFVLITTPFVAHIHNHPNDFWRFTPAGLYSLLHRAGFGMINVFQSDSTIDITTSQYGEPPKTHKVPHGTFATARRENV